MPPGISIAAAWLISLELAGLAVFALAHLAGLALRRRSAATRRALGALTIAVALALPLARLPLPAPDWRLHPTLAVAILALWSTGALLLVLRLLHGHRQAHARRRRSRPLTDPTWLASARDLRAPAVDLRVADDLDVPHTLGVLAPAILIPRRSLSAPADERRALLAHELAHVARADCLLLLAGGLARAIYWISPLPWSTLRRARTDAEHAADDAVLHRGVRSSSYAGHLLTAARDQLERAGRVAADGLRGRIRGVLDPTRVRSPAPTGALRHSVPRLVAAAALFASLATACEARSSDPVAATSNSPTTARADRHPRYPAPLACSTPPTCSPTSPPSTPAAAPTPRAASTSRAPTSAAPTSAAPCCSTPTSTAAGSTTPTCATPPSPAPP